MTPHSPSSRDRCHTSAFCPLDLAVFCHGNKCHYILLYMGASGLMYTEAPRRGQHSHGLPAVCLLLEEEHKCSRGGGLA